MKSLAKRVRTISVIAVIAAMLIACSGLILKFAAKADSGAASRFDYFYEQVSDDERAEKFYKAFETLDSSGQFKNGKVEYDLIANTVVSSDDTARYVNTGDMRVPKAYGAGRDAYIMDHPDLFYADLFGTSISAGKQGENYVAFLDTSRSLTLYKGNINSQTAVDTAIAAYEAKLNEIVEGAKAVSGVKEQITYVNKYIAEHTTYSFGTSIQDGHNVAGPEADYIDTAYGSLVNGKAICGGFAKGFKAVMDRLGIPCVCVQGYALSSGKTNFEPHMWNYVEVEGMWYAVDVTYNATGGKLDKWLLVGGQTMADTHVEDNVISSSGFELKYPALKPYDYGVDTDDNGMSIVGKYIDSSDASKKTLELTVSFEEKGAHKLQEEGKYFAFRTDGKRDEEDTNKFVWGPWFNCIGLDVAMGSFMKFEENSVSFLLHPGIQCIQFALIDYAPDVSYGLTYPDKPEYGENAGKECFVAYADEKLTDDHFIGQISVPYRNNYYGEYVPAPGMAGIYPANTGTLPVDRTYSITVTYNVSLELVEDKTEADVGMEFYTSRGNDTVKNHAVLTDVHWDGDKKITFTFTPSKMYIHNSALYYFYPTNLIGKTSKKVPDPFTYSFKGKSVVCSKIFNDGRLYMNVFGEPKMLDTSDLSVTDFKDENGNYYAQSQRSQLLLVANKPSAEQAEKMDEVLKSDTPIQDEDIVSSATYEISLQICGVVQKVPNGSYMQVAFGFPEGYSPDDKGTTFKIYHYKHDDKGNITGVEEIPVIVTEYGLIAQVKSFSPFTVVQLKNTSEAVTDTDSKNIYASVVGNGGTISTQKAEGKSGIDTVTGDSITYTIAADEGYRIANIRLNGKALDASRYTNGTLTLTKSELSAGNMLEVSFITEESAISYAQRGITLSTVQTIAPPPAKKHTAAIVIGCIAAVVVLAGAATAVYFFVFKKKQQPAKTTAKKPTKATAKK